jgi:glucose-1-phosphatase
MTQWDLLLFDLGGVIIDFDGTTPMLKLSNNRMDAEGIRRLWLESPSVRDYQTGRSDDETFARTFVAETGLDISPQAFADYFGSWQQRPMPGAVELLQHLKKHYKTGCLTNNNALHWKALMKNVDITELFHVSYASHLIGMAKPDRAVFEFVAQDQGIPAHRIAYFDDNPECVASAAQTGLAAFKTEGIQQVKSTLESIGIALL